MSNKHVVSGARSEHDQRELLLGRPRRNLLGSFAQGCTLLLVCGLPWWFGGVSAQAQVFMSFVLVGILCCWLLRELTSFPSPLVISAPVALLLIAVLWGLVQIVPLPLGILQEIAPQTATYWRPIQATLFGLEGQHSATLSLHPASTRYDLSLLVVGLCLFLIGHQLFSHLKSQEILFWCLALNGAALSAFGILQQLTWNGKLYWFHQPHHMNTPFGPFVNHNNGAGYLLMCLGAALGLTLKGLKRSGRQESEYAPVGPVRNGVLLFCLVLISTGILCSLSRGAFVAMLSAGGISLIVSLTVLHRTEHLKWAILGSIMTIGLLGWLGQTSFVQSRLATLLNQQLDENARITHWQTSLKAVPDFLAFGSGLGTYRSVYTYYEPQPIEELYGHAENQYLETLVEAGAVGLLLLLMMFALLIRIAAGLLKHERSLLGQSFAVGALFVILAQAVAALFDFGWYIPSNLILLALMTGAMSGRWAFLTYDHQAQRQIFSGEFVGRTQVAGVLAGILILGLFPLQQVYAYHQAKQERATFLKTWKNEQLSSGEREVALTLFTQQASRPSVLQLDNQFLAGRCWLDAFLQSESLQTISASQAKELQLEDLLTWSIQVRTAKQAEKVHQLLQTMEANTYLKPAVSSLIQARRISALEPRTDVLMGVLTVIISGPAADNPYFISLTQTSRRRPEVQRTMGEIFCRMGNLERGFQCWRDCLTSSPGLATQIFQRGLAYADPEQVIAQAIPQSPELLIQLATQVNQTNSEQGNLLLHSAESSLNEAQLPPAQDLYLRASIARLRNRPEQSVSHLEQAVEMAPEQSAWRYEFSQQLMEFGRIREACEQAKICVQSNPDRADYRALYQKLHRLVHSQTAPRSPQHKQPQTTQLIEL